MGSYRQLTGQQTPPERPDRVSPVEEHVKGHVYPYRGMEAHGVAPTQDDPNVLDPYYRVTGYSEDEDEMVEYAQLEKVEDPVPVYIVQGESARQRLEWRSIQVPVSDVGSSLVGRQELRRNITIKNLTGSNTIYLSPESGVSSFTGFPLAAGESYTLRSTEEIWAVCASTESANVALIWEYAVEVC